MEDTHPPPATQGRPLLGLGLALFGVIASGIGLGWALWASWQGASTTAPLCLGGLGIAVALWGLSLLLRYEVSVQLLRSYGQGLAAATLLLFAIGAPVWLILCGLWLLVLLLCLRAGPSLLLALVERSQRAR